MKKLERNRNIYIKHGRFYIDYQKDGVRIRRATGLKKSSLAFDFVRKNYELFLGSKAQIEMAQRKFYEIENKYVDRQLKKGDEVLIKNDSEFSFDSVIDGFLNEKSFLKVKTRNLYNIISRFIFDFLEYKKIFYVSDFKRQNSVDFVQYCKDKGFKKKSISIYCSFFKMIFKYAVNNEIIAKNPFFVPRFEQDLQEQGDDKIMPFSLDEILELIKNADDELRLFLVIAFFTGARTGEILALTFGDLNFKTREIRINKTLSEFGVLGSPKTKSSIRTIDMLDVVFKEFSNRKIGNENERIFNFTRYSCRAKFNFLQKKLGFKKRRLYDTRHSFASVMLSRGEEPIWVGCKMMGHKDLNETYRSYAKFLPQENKQRAIFLNDIKL